MQLMLLSIFLISQPVQNVSEAHKVVNSSGRGEIKELLSIFADSSLSGDYIFRIKTAIHEIAFAILIKELAGYVAFKVNDTALIQHQIKVVAWFASKEACEQISR